MRLVEPHNVQDAISQKLKTALQDLLISAKGEVLPTYLPGLSISVLPKLQGYVLPRELPGEYIVLVLQTEQISPWLLAQLKISLVSDTFWAQFHHLNRTLLEIVVKDGHIEYEQTKGVIAPLQQEDKKWLATLILSALNSEQ